MYIDKLQILFDKYITCYYNLVLTRAWCPSPTIVSMIKGDKSMTVDFGKAGLRLVSIGDKFKDIFEEKPNISENEFGVKLFNVLNTSRFSSDWKGKIGISNCTPDQLAAKNNDIQKMIDRQEKEQKTAFGSPSDDIELAMLSNPSVNRGGKKKIYQKAEIKVCKKAENKVYQKAENKKQTKINSSKIIIISLNKIL